MASSSVYTNTRPAVLLPSIARYVTWRRLTDWKLGHCYDVARQVDDIPSELVVDLFKRSLRLHMFHFYALL